MSIEDLLARIVGALDRAGIPHLLTGAFASSFHGAPRATQDIDIVISPTDDRLRLLVELLGRTDHYVDRAAALQALERHGRFNVVDLAAGWKVDLFIRRARTFSHLEFDRRQVVEVRGTPVAMVTAEDLVVAKLEWARLRRSERHIDDAAGILRIRVDQLDREYMEEWVRRLDLRREWKTASRAAGLQNQALRPP